MTETSSTTSSANLDRLDTYHDIYDIFIKPYFEHMENKGISIPVLFGLEKGTTAFDSYGKSVWIPSNEQGHGSYYLTGFNVERGSFIFRHFYKYASADLEKDIEVDMFSTISKYNSVTMDGGSRFYRGHFVSQLIDLLEGRDLTFEINDPHVLEIERKFLTGLLLYKYALKIFVKTYGYQYNINMLGGWRKFYKLRSSRDLYDNTFKLFELWKKDSSVLHENMKSINLKSELHDAGRLGLSLTNDLKSLGFDYNNVLSFMDRFLTYDCFRFQYDLELSEIEVRYWY